MGGRGGIARVRGEKVARLHEQERTAKVPEWEKIVRVGWWEVGSEWRVYRWRSMWELVAEGVVSQRHGGAAVRGLTTVASRNVFVQAVPGCSVQQLDLRRLATGPWCRTCQAHMRVFPICAWTAGAVVRYSIRPRARQTKVRKGTWVFAESQLRQTSKEGAARTTRDAGRCRPQPKASAACMAGIRASCALSRCHKLLPLATHVRHSPPLLSILKSRVPSTISICSLPSITPDADCLAILVHRHICLGFSSTLVLLSPSCSPPKPAGILSAPRPKAVSQPTLYHHPETSMLPPQP
jgi:hypothetical protein